MEVAQCRERQLDGLSAALKRRRWRGRIVLNQPGFLALQFPILDCDILVCKCNGNFARKPARASQPLQADQLEYLGYPNIGDLELDAVPFRCCIQRCRRNRDMPTGQDEVAIFKVEVTTFPYSEPQLELTHGQCRLHRSRFDLLPGGRGKRREAGQLNPAIKPEHRSNWTYECEAFRGKVKIAQD